jgi:hypothetical protein
MVSFDAPVTSHESLEPAWPVVAGESNGADALKLLTVGAGVSVMADFVLLPHPANEIEMRARRSKLTIAEPRASGFIFPPECS